MLPGLLISLVSLAVVFYLADLEKLVQAVRLADYRFVGLYYLISLAWLAVRAMLWRTLLQEKATLGQTFLTINEGYLLNNILPFRLGEVGRAYIMGKKALENGKPLGFWQVFPTVLIERALDVALAAGLLLSTLPFVLASDTTWAWQAALLAGGLVLTGLVMFYLLARNRQWATNLFDRLAMRWTRLQRFGGNQLHSFLSGLSILTNGGRFLRAVSLALLDWGIAILQYYVLVKAFFPQGELIWAAFSLSVMALGIAAPSSPGSVGVLELSLVGALSAFGLDSSTSLAMAITGHMSNYIITGLIGAYALARDGMTLTGVYRQVREIAPQEDQSL